MPDRIRFYIDEHIPAAVSSGLAQRGLDVLTAQRANRAGVGDIDQLVFARDEQRVFVTFDIDFLRLADFERHTGIVWCPASKYSIGELIRALFLVATVLTPDEMINHVEYL